MTTARTVLSGVRYLSMDLESLSLRPRAHRRGGSSRRLLARVSGRVAPAMPVRVPASRMLCPVSQVSFPLSRARLLVPPVQVLQPAPVTLVRAPSDDLLHAP